MQTNELKLMLKCHFGLLMGANPLKTGDRRPRRARVDFNMPKVRQVLCSPDLPFIRLATRFTVFRPCFLVHFRSPRALLVLALLGWLAQFCLPLAHAAAMAEGGLGVAAWCGQNSPALEAKLAELPADIRDILKDSLGHAEQASDNCSDLCVTPLGGALPAAPATVALRAAGIEKPQLDKRVAPALAARPSPPVRGPPAAI